LVLLIFSIFFLITINKYTSECESPLDYSSRRVYTKVLPVSSMGMIVMTSGTFFICLYHVIDQGLESVAWQITNGAFMILFTFYWTNVYIMAFEKRSKDYPILIGKDGKQI
jgi:uncharacterized membrane protein